MQIGAYMADWERLTAAWKEQGNNIYLGDAIDNEEDWIEDIPEECSDSFGYALDVGEVFPLMQPHMPPGSAEEFEWFLSAFCPLDKQPVRQPPCDLFQTDVYFATLSPETVGKYLALFRRFNFDDLVEPFARVADEHGTEGPESVDDIVTYMKQWGRLLERANDKGYGVVCCAG